MRSTRTMAQQQGAGAALREIGRRLLYVTSATWYERDLALPIEPPACSVEAAIVLDAPLRTLAALPEQDRHPQLVRTALECNHVLAHAALDSRAVGYVLVGVEQAYVHDYRQCLDLPPDAAFIYDTFVARELRGRRLMGRLVGACLRSLQARGVKRVFCHIPDWNQSSQRAYRRLGFAAVGRVTYARVAGMGFFVESPYRLLRRAQGSRGLAPRG